jgi:hypothetical protein
VADDDALSADGLLPGGMKGGTAKPARAPRSAARSEKVAGFQIAAYRDDGPISLWLGKLVEGRIPPVPPALVGVFVTAALAALGMGNLSGVLVLTPVEAMLLAGLGSSHPHDGRLDWLVPALLQTGEYLFLAALAFTRLVAPPLVFALLAAVVLRHLDVAYRARHRIIWPAAGAAGQAAKPSPAPAAAPAEGAAPATPGRGRGRRSGGRAVPARERPEPAPRPAASASHGLTWPPTAADGRPADVTGLGWEVRMLVLGIGAALGVTPFACVALAGYLWALVVRDFLTGWMGVRDEPAHSA